MNADKRPTFRTAGELPRVDERYAGNIIGAFTKWIDRWVSQERACHDAIETAEETLNDFLLKISVALRATNPSGSAEFPHWPDPPSLSQQCDLSSVVSNPIAPERPDLLQTYGLFGWLAGWLVKLESPDLVLIIGLLGFGLFGALAAPAIRQSARPRVGRQTVNAAFVRGISAALLMYLAVVGGLAVFARNASPNPYSVYFACLVASIFSECLGFGSSAAKERSH